MSEHWNQTELNNMFKYPATKKNQILYVAIKKIFKKYLKLLIQYV